MSPFLAFYILIKFWTLKTTLDQSILIIINSLTNEWLIIRSKTELDNLELNLFAFFGSLQLDIQRTEFPHILELWHYDIQGPIAPVKKAYN